MRIFKIFNSILYAFILLIDLSDQLYKSKSKLSITIPCGNYILASLESDLSD